MAKSRKCNKCNQRKKLSQFGDNKICNLCKKKSYEENKTRIAARNKTYYDMNVESIKLRQHSYYLQNKESISIRKKEYLKNNPKVRKSNLDRKHKIKQECYGILGDKCCTCNYQNPEALYIGQISGPKLSLFKTRKFIVDTKNKDGFYQLLCANCTSKKSPPTKSGRFEALIHLGGPSCYLCGVSDQSVLNIEYGSYSKTKIYDQILNSKIDRSKLKIICMNCIISPDFSKSVALNQTQRENQLIKPVYDLINFDFKSTNMIENYSEEHRKFLDEFHYAGYGRAAKISYEVKLDGQFIALVKFATPVRLEVATTLDYKYEEVLELDRFCIHPTYQKKNFASYIMSKVTKLVESKFPELQCLASFADTRENHQGTIYKASNWICVGQTSNSYCYIDNNGEEHNKKSVYNQAKRLGLTENQYVKSNYLKKIVLPPKIKYVYYLHGKHETMRKTLLKSNG